MHVGFWCPNGRHVVQKGDVLELVKKTWLQHRQSLAEELLGWYFRESWTLSPYWAAAFCSFALEYLWSANISKIFLAVCWVSTSNCSIHFLISPCGSTLRLLVPYNWLGRNSSLLQPSKMPLAVEPGLNVEPKLLDPVVSWLLGWLPMLWLNLSVFWELPLGVVLQMVQWDLLPGLVNQQQVD